MAGTIPHLIMAACLMALGFLAGVIWHMQQADQRAEYLYAAIARLNERLHELQAMISEAEQ